MGHQTILDPTSTLPVYPSQATQVKDWSFGTGRGNVTEDLLAKYHQLSPEVQPSQVLIPNRLRYIRGHKQYWLILRL